MDNLPPHAQIGKPYTIYALIDPRDHNVRYIGITNDVYARFAQHVRGDGSNPEKDRWIEELRQAQIMLIMKTLEVVETVEQAREREKHWIHHHRFLGANLLNLVVPTIHVPVSPVASKQPLHKGVGGRQSTYDHVKNLVVYRHQYGQWPASLSADMRRWYEKQYFRKPTRRKDGDYYSKHLKTYNRGQQWIAEFEASSDSHPLEPMPVPTGGRDYPDLEEGE